MKSQAIQYLALDVHQSTIVGTVRNDGGGVQLRATVPTEAHAVVQLVRAAGPRVWVAFEEGTQSQWLHDLLEPHAEKVIVCNTRELPERGNKNDRTDADRLADLLRRGSLKPVYHGSKSVLPLQELVRNYIALVQDSTRVMLRIKALFRARAIATPGQTVYGSRHRQQYLSQLRGRAVRLRAETLYAELDVMMKLRPPAKAAMIAEARRHTGWRILRSVPMLGPVRTAQLLAILRTPHRFRTKRQLWPYAGLAVVTRSSADHKYVDGQLKKRRRAPLTRGLNRNHNPVLKEIFKGAATAAAAKGGPLHAFFDSMVARGMRPEMAKLTVARKIAAIVLRLWKKGELYDPTKLTTQC
jgi:transposase